MLDSLSIVLLASGLLTPIESTAPFFPLAGGPDSEIPAHREARIYGGTPAAACGWPSTVQLGGCTGTLVHPELVVLAAHCIREGNPEVVRLGESFDAPARTVPIDDCESHPDFVNDPGGNDLYDYAWCRLAEAEHAIPIIPIAVGCETDGIEADAAVVIVGFGNADISEPGLKNTAETTVVETVGQTEALVGRNGTSCCQGDSGGPTFLEVSPGEWRVFGVNSRTAGECGEGCFVGLLHVALPWLEQSTGLDLTPCFSDDGAWSPTQDCGAFPSQPATGGSTWSDSCGGGPVTAFSNMCGDPFDPGDDGDSSEGSDDADDDADDGSDDGSSDSDSDSDDGDSGQDDGDGTTSVGDSDTSSELGDGQNDEGDESGDGDGDGDGDGEQDSESSEQDEGPSASSDIDAQQGCSIERPVASTGRRDHVLLLRFLPLASLRRTHGGTVTNARP